MKSKRVTIKQHDMSDCGAACLASVSAWYGLEEPLAKIRQYASTGRHGTNLLGMTRAAKKLGFDSKAVEAEASLLTQLPMPAIAHVILSGGLHHYIVLYEVRAVRVKVMDPATGSLDWLSKKTFEQQWSGVLMLITPGRDFEKGNRRVPVHTRLWYLLKPHRSVLLQALFGAALYTIAGLSTAIYVQLVVDHVLIDENRGLLHLLGTAMILILLLQTFVGAVKALFVLKTGQLIDARLLIGYYRHLLTLPQHFFDRMRTGELISRLNDAVKIRTFINDAALHLAVNLFIFIFSFALMFTYYWKLGLFMVMIIPAYALVYMIVNRLHKKTQRMVMEQSAELESQLVESIRTISTIKQFGLEPFTETRTEVRFVELLKSVYRSGINSLFSATASDLISSAFTILILWIGAIHVLDGAITAGELLSFYAILSYFTRPAEELVEMNKLIQDAAIAGDRLFEIMDLENEEQKRTLELKPDHIGDIRFEGVTFGYGSGPPIFEQLSLRIAADKTTAFVGESGSGKSTLFYILQKLYPLQKGRVRIGELSTDQIDSRSLRRRVGTVPQKVDLFSGSIADNIALGEFEPDMDRIIAICSELGMLEFVERLPDGFNSPVGENGTRLSGGQRQRLAIARALYRDPEILLMDEATSSLDSASEQQILRSLERFGKRRKTIILIAHRLSTVRRADRIFVLNRGKVVESGTHTELIRMQRQYAGLWREQLPSNG